MPGLCVGDREARADGQGGKLIDRIAAGAPVRELLLIEALGHTRVPFLGYRPDLLSGKQDEKTYCLTGECSRDVKRCLSKRCSRCLIDPPAEPQLLF